ncbi:MAG: hypothetical protein KKE16_03010 [Firmicutes bacterium]|nr:hypothetical protein [Bacillota bacterium]
MFQRDQLTIGDWILYYILMVIPLVNIVIFLMILFSSTVNKTLKNMLWTSVLAFIIVLALLFTVLSPLLYDLWSLVQSYLPY